MTANIGTKGVPRAEREGQILDAAATEFGDRGYAAASVTAVALAAGISKPLVYSYFGSKDGLFLACLRRGADRVIADIEAARHARGVRLPAETLRAIFTALAPRPADWSLIHDTTAPAGSRSAAAAAGYRARLDDLADEGVGVFLDERGNTDPRDASALARVWNSAITALVTWWVAHPAETAEDMSARCERLVEALFGPG